MRLHRELMATVAVLEAGTYAYMAWRYETPVSVVAWALILSRALAAPLLSVYLAMARPLPVTARDILAQVELASGLGLIRDAVTRQRCFRLSPCKGRPLRRICRDDATGSRAIRWLARGCGGATRLPVRQGLYPAEASHGYSRGGGHGQRALSVLSSNHRTASNGSQ